MVLTTNAFPVKAGEEEEKVGELRRDSEGKGYFYRFDKEKKVEDLKVKIVPETEELKEQPVKVETKKKFLSRRKK